MDKQLSEALPVPPGAHGGIARYRAIVWTVFILPLPVLLVTIYVLPLVGVMTWSVTDPPGLENYARIAEAPAIQGAFLRTMRICAVVTAITVLAAYIAAYNWVFGSSLRRRVVAVVVLMSFWISVLIRALGWVALLRTRGVINEILLGLGVVSEPLRMMATEGAVVVGMVHFLLPFAVLPIVASMRQLDPRMLLAARGLGASRGVSFRYILFPNTLPGVLGATFIVFIFSLGFFITPALLGGGRVIMIAEYVFLQMTQTAQWGIGAAICTVLLVIVALLTKALTMLVRVENLVDRR